MHFGRFGILSIFVLIADIYAILNVLQSTEENFKKAIWVALIIVLPFLGAVLWFFFGPRSASALR